MINRDKIMQLVAPPPPFTSPIDVSQNSIRIPLVGRIQFVNDSQGIMLVSGILAYWVYGTFSTLYIVLEPAYNDGLIPKFIIYSFLTVSLLCLLSLVRATFTNPGQIPDSSNADETWNLCDTCNRMRPPRAHHCRRCGQCVMRMDHHCPWINNCVGEGNHFAFMQLLVYAFLLSLYTLILNLLHFWIFPKCIKCNQDVLYIKHGVWFMYLTFILALNMTSVMGAMMWQHHVNLLINKTTLENMMNSDSGQRLQIRRCFYAYKELCGQGLPIFWFCPLGRRKPVLPYQIHDTV